MVINCTPIHVKNNVKFTNLMINYELKGIMVNEGRIQREIRDFREIFWKLIKWDDKLVIQIRENRRFRNITQRRIHRIKNHLIWISIRGEIKERSGDKFLNAI